MPTTKEILDAIQKLGSKAAAARELGMAVSTLKDRLRRGDEERPEIRAMRDLERQLSSSKSKLELERQKRGQAEIDLQRANGTLESILQTQSRTNPRELKRLKSSSKGQATAVLCLTDWHAEERVDPAVVGGVNKFDLAVAEQRIDRLWQKSLYMLDFASGISDIKDLVIWIGGDLINGDLIDEMSESNFLGPTEAILFVQDHIASGIEFLLGETKLDLRVVTSLGNHGRTTKKPHIATGYMHNLEFLAYSNLERLYRANKRVDFQVERGYHTWCDIQGYPVRFHHGDAINYSGGVGGVTVPLRRKVAQWNKVRHAYLDVVGHFHQYLDAWDIVLCGCLAGYNAYAISIGAEYQPPTQTFMVLDKNHGKVMTLPIFV